MGIKIMGGIMNYDEIATGTVFKHKEGSESNTVFKFVEELNNNKVAVDMFDLEDNWLGVRYMYKTYFERFYEIAKNADYIEGEEDE
jgi:hypothetical protein